MPTKYAKSVMKYDRATGKRWMEHYYAKTLSTQELLDLINSSKNSCEDPEDWRGKRFSE